MSRHRSSFSWALRTLLSLVLRRGEEITVTGADVFAWRDGEGSRDWVRAREEPFLRRDPLFLPGYVKWDPNRWCASSAKHDKDRRFRFYNGVPYLPVSSTWSLLWQTPLLVGPTPYSVKEVVSKQVGLSKIDLFAESTWCKWKFMNQFSFFKKFKNQKMNSPI